MGYRAKLIFFQTISDYFPSEKTTALHEDDSDDEVNSALKIMTKTVGAYTEKSDVLPKTILQHQILPEITIGHHEAKAVSVLRFHRSKNVLFVADLGGSVKLYEVHQFFSFFPVKSQFPGR